MSTSRATTPLAEGMIRCALCGGDFPRLGTSVVDGCEACVSYKGAFGPAHFSMDSCQSGGARRHADCIGRKSHCTCDRCF